VCVELGLRKIWQILRLNQAFKINVFGTDESVL
jgi:hypothetical protein